MNQKCWSASLGGAHLGAVATPAPDEAHWQPCHVALQCIQMTQQKSSVNVDDKNTWVWASSPVTMFPTVRRAGIRTVGDGCLEKKKF